MINFCIYTGRNFSILFKHFNRILSRSGLYFISILRKEIYNRTDGQQALKTTPKASFVQNYTELMLLSFCVWIRFMYVYIYIAI